MADSTMLPLALLLPLAGMLLVALLPAALARGVALAAMLATLALAAAMFAGFDPAAATPQYAFDWAPRLAGGLAFGVDAFNVYLLLLTALLFPVALGALWSADESRSRLYLALLLALEACLLGTFVTQNLVVFFVFWEAVLIPMLLLILVFGGAERRRAALVFFLYTMAGSVLLLAAVILLGVAHLNEFGSWSFRYDDLVAVHLSPGQQLFVFVAVALACAIKSPIVPFHSWLPLAYGQAPAAGTALMAGVLSKMGAFGFLRLAVPLAPDVAPLLAPALAALAVASLLYGAVMALRQTDYRQIVAWASLSHMGFIALGVFSFQQAAVHGAMLQILSHGVGVAGLFLLLALLERRGVAGGAQAQMLATRAPRLAVLGMLLVLASLGLPLTSGFTAEFMILAGAFREGWSQWQTGAGALHLAAAVLAALAVVLGAAYMLRFARQLLFGGERGDAPAAPLPDLGVREAAAFAPLLAAILWIGVWPAPLVARAQPAVSQIAGYATVWRPGAAAALPPAAQAVAKEAVHGR